MDKSYIIFFFQAEDGIRDTSVTGVQTCALPISMVLMPEITDQVAGVGHIQFISLGLITDVHAALEGWRLSPRSEERRVGKECRFGRQTDGNRNESISGGDSNTSTYTTTSDAAR